MSCGAKLLILDKALLDVSTRACLILWMGMRGIEKKKKKNSKKKKNLTP